MPVRAVVFLSIGSALLAGCGLLRVGRGDAAARLPEISAVHEFVVPWQNAYPNDVAVDSGGRLWFTDRLAHVLGMFDPATREFRSYSPPTSGSAPYGIIAAPDGGIWYAASRRGLLGRVDPATGVIEEHVVTESGGPQLLWWHAGEIWFSVREARSYGRFDPSTGHATVHVLERESPYSVVATRGMIWFSSFQSYRLIAVDPRTGEALVKDLRQLSDSGQARRWYGGQIRRLAHDHEAVWFTDLSGNRLGRYDIANDRLQLFPAMEPGTQPYGIGVCCGGIVWFAERGTNRIVALEPVSGQQLPIDIPAPNGFVRHLVIDERRRHVWLPVSEAGRIVLVEYR